MCPIRKGLSRSIPILRMGLEPENSYSREGSGFLGYCSRHTKEMCSFFFSFSGGGGIVSYHHTSIYM